MRRKSFYIYVIIIYTISFSGCTKQQHSIYGIWQGDLNINGVSSTLFMKIEKTNNDQFLVTIDCPDQGLYDLRTLNTTLISDSLKMNIPAYNSAFKGALNKQATQIKGLWKPPCCNGVEMEFSKN